MHPGDHAKTSVKIWGGKEEDYTPIHNWLDATKETFADYRHRALRHHSQGIYEAERVFGMDITNSDGKKVHVRYICEQHIRRLRWDDSHRCRLVSQHQTRSLDGPRLSSRAGR